MKGHSAEHHLFRPNMQRLGPRLRGTGAIVLFDAHRAGSWLICLALKRYVFQVGAQYTLCFHFSSSRATTLCYCWETAIKQASKSFSQSIQIKNVLSCRPTGGWGIYELSSCLLISYLKLFIVFVFSVHCHYLQRPDM